VDHQRIILEASPAYSILCLALALGLSYLLYKTTHPWSKAWNWILSGVRFVLIFFILFLLLGPIVKQINNIFKKPVFVILHDNSSSIAEGTDSMMLDQTERELSKTKDKLNNHGYDVEMTDLSGELVDQIEYTDPSTDLNGALKKIIQRHEGKRIGGVILPSDDPLTFKTHLAERIEIISGQCSVIVGDDPEMQIYASGESFQIPANSQFKIQTSEVVDYVCHFE